MISTKYGRKMTAEELRVAPMKQAFVDAYGVKQYEPRYMNYQRLLAQGGAGNEAVKRLLKDYFGAFYQQMLNYTGVDNLFDHLELWGRDRTPLFLIGHPYKDLKTLPTRGVLMLKAIRSLGLSVRVLNKSHSWYGHGAMQIAVYHWPTVERLCRPCPIYPPTPERQALVDILEFNRMMREPL